MDRSAERSQRHPGPSAIAGGASAGAEQADAVATRNDFGTVQGLGHDTKGAGASFGCQTITDIGAALEAEAGNADTDASLRWVGELSTFLDGVGLDADLSGGPPPSDPREATTVARRCLELNNEPQLKPYVDIPRMAGLRLTKASSDSFNISSPSPAMRGMST